MNTKKIRKLSLLAILITFLATMHAMDSAANSLDIEFEVKEEKSINKAVIIKAEDGSQEKLPVSLLLSFDFFKFATEGEQDKFAGVKAITDHINKSALFKNKVQLELFAKSLEFIKEMELAQEVPRSIVRQLSASILLGSSFEDLVSLWRISNFLDIKILCSSVTNTIILGHGEKVHKVIKKHKDLYKESSLDNQLIEQLKRMHFCQYEEKNPVRAINNLVEDGFLPGLFKNLGKLDKTAIWEKLSDERQFSNDCVSSIISQLPHSDLKSYLIRAIQEQIKKNFKNNNFSFIDWYLKLPEGRADNSPRTQILNFLQNEAENIVVLGLLNKTHEEAQQRFRLLNLPESYFKMLVRYEYHQRRRFLIDDYKIDKIWRKIFNYVFNYDFFDLRNLNLTDLDGVIDLLIIRNEMNPVKFLCLDNNNICVIPKTIVNLNNLEDLSFEKNEVSIIPEVIGKLITLKHLSFISNKISIIPTCISNLKELRSLYFDDNKISEVPGFINNLRKLRVLGWSGNPIK